MKIERPEGIGDSRFYKFKARMKFGLSSSNGRIEFQPSRSHIEEFAENLNRDHSGTSAAMLNHELDSLFLLN